MSTDKAEHAARRRPVRASELKKRRYLVPVEKDTYFRVRKIDLPMLFFEGAVPAPLMNAVDRFQTTRKAFARSEDGDGGLLQSLADLTEQTKKQFLEVVRRVAVAITVEPKLTHSKLAAKRDENLLWVGGLSDIPEEMNTPNPQEEDGDVSKDALMVLWRTCMGEVGLVVMTDDEAEDFRTQQSRVAPEPVLHVEGVRTETAHVDTFGRDNVPPVYSPGGVEREVVSRR